MARKLGPFSNPSLLKSLRPAIFLAKVLGVFPFKIVLDTDSNSNTFSLPILCHSWLSRETAYSLLFLLGLCITSSFYMPFTFFMNDQYSNHATYSNLTESERLSLADGGKVEFLPDLVFLIGEWLTGIITLVLIHFMAPRFVKTWNKCQAYLSILAQLQQRAIARPNVPTPPKALYTVEAVYRRVVITTALFLLGFFFILIGYTITFTLYFWRYFFMYCTNESLQPLFIAGFAFTFVQVIGHLLHTVIFCTFVRVLERMLFILHELAAGSAEGLDYITDFGKYIKLYNFFCSVEDLSKKLGANYGFYLINQAIIIMATILVNLYGLFFHPRITSIDSNALYYFSHAFILPPIAIVVCIGCLIIWCNLGEVFQRSAKRTAKTIREAALRNLSEECNFKITAFQYRLTHSRLRLTAAGFFSIHRKLLGQIIALMMTYMIFLLQIKLL